MPNKEIEAEFTVLLAGNLSFKDWEIWTDACRADKIPTYSKTTHTCPNCGTEAPSMWHIFIREADKSLLDE
jgi:hypothetical protein